MAKANREKDIAKLFADGRAIDAAMARAVRRAIALDKAVAKVMASQAWAGRPESVRKKKRREK